VLNRVKQQREEAVAEAAATASAQQSEAANIALRAQLAQQKEMIATEKDRNTALQQELQQQQQQIQEQQHQMQKQQKQLQQLQDNNATAAHTAYVTLRSQLVQQQEMTAAEKDRNTALCAQLAQLKEMTATEKDTNTALQQQVVQQQREKAVAEAAATASAQQSEAAIIALRAQLELLERSWECFMCFGTMGGGNMVALVPCGHLLCRQCAPSVEVQAPCPTCRKEVTGCHDVYIG
jgi:DNA repair exonuclease SbcCD ATPase subunit